MFTGIIQEIGQIRRLDASGGLYRLAVAAPAVSRDAKVGDSIAVNGVCLTVTGRDREVITFDVMQETVRKTGLVDLKAGGRVNVEASLKADGKIGGHFVQGHIDCVGTVRSFSKSGDDVVMEVAFPEEYGHLAVGKGSIAIDGVSLTIGSVTPSSLSAYLIPLTLAATTLGAKERGSKVNLEFDIIGKYIARFGELKRPGAITEEFLRSHGF